MRKPNDETVEIGDVIFALLSMRDRNYNKIVYTVAAELEARGVFSENAVRQARLYADWKLVGGR